MKPSCCLWIQCCKFPGSAKIGFRDRIKMNSSRSTQALRNKASSPVPPGSVRQSPSNENMPEATSPSKVQKSWSFNDRTRFRTSLRLKPRPSTDGTIQRSVLYVTFIKSPELKNVSLMIFFSFVVEGVGEENTEDKSYCDVAVEDVIPAVKTLIRAVRWVRPMVVGFTKVVTWALKSRLHFICQFQALCMPFSP